VSDSVGEDPAGPTPREAATDRIPPFTRWLAIALLPFLAIASVLLYVLPRDTDRLFAWTIDPPLTAMFLASAYLGGIWFFVQVARLRHWHRVRYGFPAVLVFATLLGAATLIHLDRFHPGHISFIAWFALYVTTPFLVLGVLVANRGLDPRRPEEFDYAIPAATRVVLVAVGVCALVSGLILFLLPQTLVDVWAWDLTPLTARVVGAILTLPGLVNIWLVSDARWSAFRWMFQAQLFSLVFILGALAIARDDLEWSRPATGLVVGGLVFSVIAYAAFYLYCDSRRRASAPPDSTA